MRRFCLYLTLFLSFLLGARDGFLALWILPARDPACVFPCRIDSLPPEDQRSLTKGVRAESREELMGLLEDYIS